MNDLNSDLVFVPLGGLGEIGMNAGAYGFGPPGRRKWLLVDCGVTFAGEEAPGIDLILPQLDFLERERQNLVGIVITHAHEDHIGALAALWPRLGVKVYASRFAVDLLEARRLGEPGAPKIPLSVVAPGMRVEIGPFNVEFISVAHSIPESMALAIRTPHGLVLHSGDWKIDPTPVVGQPTDEARLRALGEEGVLALLCDSTNMVRDGVSPSEADAARRR
jgi:ribonuclease J